MTSSSVISGGSIPRKSCSAIKERGAIRTLFRLRFETAPAGSMSHLRCHFVEMVAASPVWICYHQMSLLEVKIIFIQVHLEPQRKPQEWRSFHLALDVIWDL